MNCCFLGGGGGGGDGFGSANSPTRPGVALNQ